MAALLIGWLLIGSFFGGFVQTMIASAEDGEVGFNSAFWYAQTFYENNCEQLNRAGLIIGITFISILVLPGSILIIGISAFMKLMEKLWGLYKYIFKQKEKNDG